MKKTLLLVLIVCLSLVQISYAETTVELTASKDVWLEKNDNMNGYDFFIVGKHSVYPKKRSLLEFDFSSIPSNAKVTDATLSIYHIYCHGSSFPHPVDVYVHQVLKSWEENTATSYRRNLVDYWDEQYLNFGTDAAATAETIVDIGKDNGYKYFDLTNITNKWIRGEEPNYGMLLWTPNEIGTVCDRRFHSREYSEDAKRPKLTVTYITEPECNTSSDCGTDGFTGDYFCQDDDVYRDYITYTCNNPETLDSYCSDSTAGQMVEDCGTYGFCVEGDPECTFLHPNKTTVELTSAKDTWLEGPSSKNYYDYFIVGKQPGYYKKRSLLEFDLSSLSSLITIEDATLQLYHYTCYGGTPVPAVDIQIHEVLKPWNERSATSIRRNNENLWDALYLNFGTDAKSEAESIVNIGTNNGYKYFDLTDLAQRWIGGEDNNGILLWTPNEDTGPCDRRFYSREHSNPSKRPKLTLTYSPKTCSLASECGIDSLIGNYYCQDGDVYQDFISYACNFVEDEPGFCSDSITPQLIDACGTDERCIDGESECIMVPPTTSIIELNASKDVWIEDTRSKSAYQYFAVGKQANNAKKRSLLEFDLSALPSDSSIINATLQLYQSSCQGSAPVDIQIHSVLKSWIESQANAYRRTDGIYWEDPYLNLGIDAAAEADAILDMGSDKGYKYFDLTALARAWYSGNEENNGMLLWTPDENIDTCERQFYSREYSDPTKTPKLLIEYGVIACGNDGDCGTETTEYICQDGDVYSNTTTYTCNNPGTFYSYCSSSTIPTLVDNCAVDEICIDGFDQCQLNLTPMNLNLTPSKDVWISGGTNMNYINFLIIGRQTGYAKKRSLLEFDVSCIPSNAIITDSSLEMYHIYCHGGGTIPAIDVHVHQVLTEWVESEATVSKASYWYRWHDYFLSFGLDAKALAESIVNIGADNGWKFFDLTSLTTKWITGEEENKGVLVWTPNEDVGPCDRRFHPREVSDYDLRPKLAITGYTNETSFTTKFYMDSDGDGYGNPDSAVEECSAPYRYITDGTDCNDSISYINPGATETCNNADEDCDGLIDEYLIQLFYTGPSGTQGVGICTAGEETCNAGAWYLTQDEVTPEAELCDGFDNDCNSTIDDGYDLDGDTYATCTGDCDDTDPLVNPAQSEVCDGVDNDCNDVIDDGVCAGTCIDDDNDKYGVNGDATCTNPGEPDCDDTRKKVNPSETESCSTPYDDNCDGVVNEGCDNDLDGFTPPTDCNDENDAINPDATEVCNSIDDNCNGQVDENGGCIDSDGDLIVDDIDICPSDPDNNCQDNATQEYVTSTTTTTLSTQNGEAAIQISPGDFATDTVITISKNTGLEPNFALSTGTTDVKNVFSYTFSPEGQQFDGDFVVAMYWDDVDNDGNEDTTGLRENKIDIYWYNPITTKWEAQGATCNLVNNYCTLITDHFSDYAMAILDDEDEDGYTSDEDCDDTNPDVNPGALEACNGIDDNCDDIIDEQGDLLCGDGLYCNGEEICSGLDGCQAGASPDCSVNDLASIETCENDPDNNILTWDYFAGFISICDEELDVCTSGVIDLTHTCSVADCDAECESDDDCPETECDQLDMCYDGTYIDYDDVDNTCTDDCGCTQNECTVYDEVITDVDGDGYDIECDNDCDDSDAAINPSAFEIPGNDVDENCDSEVVCDSTAEWKNHGAFVSCVTQAAQDLVKAGFITGKEKGEMVSEAAQSDVGK